MNGKTPAARQKLGTDFREPRGEEGKPPTFALAAKRFRAIDLSRRTCDACGAGAGCWAWIPGGGLRFAPVFTPNLRLVTGRTQRFCDIRAELTYGTKLKLDKEVGGGVLRRR